MRLKELLARRAALVAEQRALLDKASTEKRELTTEETVIYDRMDSDFEKIEKDIEAEERLLAREKKIADGIEANAGTGAEEDGALTAMDGMRSWLRGGEDGMNPDEVRALQSDSDTQGGFLVTPVQMVDMLIEAIRDEVFMRGLATVHTVTEAESLGAASLDARPSNPSFGAEVGSITRDAQMAFGNRELTPHMDAIEILVSMNLLRLTAGGAESIVTDQLGYTFGINEENEFLNGDGSLSPLGVFTASNNGITTARDVSEDNTTTKITADGLINALYALKGGYQSRASWIFHRDAVKMIRKLKDGEGQYLWAPGLAGGEPDTILQKPFFMSEYAPNTFTTGLYVGIVGDFSKYWIADAQRLEIQRLVELYAKTSQIGFIGRRWVDGMPVLAEAFTRVKLG